MIKKLSIIFICILLIGATNISFMGFCCPVYVYAEENIDQPSDEDLEKIALTTYVNSRNGYFTGSAGAVVSVMSQYIRTYYESEMNLTNINNTSEFVNHINIGIKDGKYSVNIDSEGIQFLNGLWRYLLGQNKFPELYTPGTGSGGTWGNGETLDEVDKAFLNAGNVFYEINASDTNSVYIYCRELDPSKVKPGTAVGLMTSEYLYNIYKSNNNNLDMNTTVGQNEMLKVPITINFTSNVSRNFNLSIRSSSFTADDIGNLNDYLPMITLSNSSVSGQSTKVNWLSKAVYSTRDLQIRGNPALFRITFKGDVVSLKYGFISYSLSENKYFITTLENLNSNSITSNQNVNFKTYDFIKDDLELKEQEFIPANNSTGENVYYTTNEYNNSSEFVTQYYNDYIEEKTVINNTYVEPEEPGGNVPDWSGNGGSGTITPDGNGGYTFNLPDFELPDLDIDWKISGLTEKFPFSIPFDLIAFFTVLNAEPVTPELQAEIPLGRYSWEIDWSMDQFEPLAIILRNLEFIGFCIGLALITRHIIKG